MYSFSSRNFDKWIVLHDISEVNGRSVSQEFFSTGLHACAISFAVIGCEKRRCEELIGCRGTRETQAKLPRNPAKNIRTWMTTFTAAERQPVNLLCPKNGTWTPFFRVQFLSGVAVVLAPSCLHVRWRFFSVVRVTGNNDHYLAFADLQVAPSRILVVIPNLKSIMSRLVAPRDVHVLLSHLLYDVTTLQSDELTVQFSPCLIQWPQNVFGVIFVVFDEASINDEDSLEPLFQQGQQTKFFQAPGVAERQERWGTGSDVVDLKDLA